MTTNKVRKITRRDLVGRTITNVTFETVESSTSTPGVEQAIGTITLDNGRRIWFRTIELEGGGEYGVDALTMTIRKKGS
jgi:hypothetical protein